MTGQNGFDAMRNTVMLKPDAITRDIEILVMAGIAASKKIICNLLTPHNIKMSDVRLLFNR